jgi:two-component sensor histidine kinase
VTDSDFDRARPEQDPQTLGPFVAGGGMLAISSVLGGIMAFVQPGLSRPQRVVAGVGCAVLGTVGVGAWRSAPGFARLTRSRPQVAVIGLAAVSGATTTFGGGYQSPGYFPGIIATAVGGGYLARRDSLRYGVVIGTAYTAGSLATAKPWRPDAPDIWWNIGSAAMFIAAASIGSRAGALSMTLRGLELARRRDREAIAGSGLARSSAEELADRSATVAEAARRVERAISELTRAAEQSGLASGEDLRTRARQDSQGLHHLTLAPQLLGLATASKVETLEDRVAAICRGSLSPEIKTSSYVSSTVPAQIDARSATPLIQALKRALDNAQQHTDQRPLTIKVSVSLSASGDVVLDVEDNGGGGPVPRKEWGEGFQLTEEQLSRIGGQLRLLPGTAGLRMQAVVPVVEQEPTVAANSSVVAGVDHTTGQIIADVRVAAAWHSVMILCANTPPADRVRRSVRLVALLLVGELASRRPNSMPWSGLPSTAIIAAAAFPGPGRPVTGGWSTTLVVDYITRTGARGYGAAAGVAAASMIAAGRATLTELHLTVGDRLFPLFGSAAGLLAYRQRTNVARGEKELVAMGDRLALIEQVSLPLQLRHDVLKQLRRSRVWTSLLNLPAGQQLVASEEALLAATAALEPMLLIAGSPIELIVQQLTFRLAPTVIRPPNREVVLQLAERRRTIGRGLRAGRERLWLIRLGDQIAEEMLALVPPSPTGRWRLREVIISLTADRDDLILSFRPIPVGRDRPRSRAEYLSQVAEALGGQIVEGYNDGMRSVRLPANIFAT